MATFHGVTSERDSASFVRTTVEWEYFNPPFGPTKVGINSNPYSLFHWAFERPIFVLMCVGDIFDFKFPRLVKFCPSINCSIDWSLFSVCDSLMLILLNSFHFNFGCFFTRKKQKPLSRTWELYSYCLLARSIPKSV